MPVPVQNAVMDAVSALVQSSPMNLGLLLVPMFTYKRGMVWQEEMRVISNLAKLGLVCDRSFAVLFNEKCDLREVQPLEFRGRLLEPSASNSADSVWKGCQLFRGYTALAEQVKASNMEWIEDLDPVALLPSCDDSSVTIQGAKKSVQLGGDALWEDPQRPHQRQ